MKNKLLLLIILLMPISVFALDYPSINSKYVEVYDLNDKQVLYEVDSDKVVSIASLTKIATTITAIETIDNLDEKVTITNEMLNTVEYGYSIAGLQAGDVVTYKDLLYASMLPSGADATNSIAILSSGTIDNYIVKMNDLAKKVGLNHTKFSNVVGKDDKNHYSTADDVRKLLEYSLNNELFREIYTTKKYTLSNGLTVKTTLYTYGANADTSLILGSKTGFTLNAGYCLSSLSNINGHDMIIIVLNAVKENNKFYNIVDTLDLINFLNNNYKDEVLVTEGTSVESIPVILSKIGNYEVKVNKDITKYLPSDYDKDKVKYEYEGKKMLSFFNDKGDNIGVIKYYYDGKLFYEQNVDLENDIKFNFIYLLILIIIGFAVYIIIIGFAVYIEAKMKSR